jgi:hypothetical protein
VQQLKWLFFLDLSMVDRRSHDDLRKVYLHLKAPRFDLHRQQPVALAGVHRRRRGREAAEACRRPEGRYMSVEFDSEAA